MPKGEKFAETVTPFPYIRVTDLANFSIDTSDLRYLTPEIQATIERYTISKNDVYISIAGSIGITGMIPARLDGANLTENAAKLVLKEDVIAPRFLMYYLASEVAQTEIRGQTVKNAQPKLALVRIASLEIPLPPLPEQRKIAAVLGVVQRAIEQQKRLIALTTELKKALLHKLFTEGLCGEPKKQTEIGSVPESWEIAPCEKLCEMITVGVVVKPASHYVSKGVQAFRSFNVREDRLETNDLVFFSEEDNDTKLAKSKLRTGDVLVVRTGYPGTSCVVPKEYDGSNCIDLVIVRPKAGVIRSGFLSRFFNAPAGKSQAVASKHGLAQQHLNVSAVKRTLVPVPSLVEQDEIDSVLATVQRKIALISAKKETLADLFRSLLHQLMTAQIRVNDLKLDDLEATGTE